MATAIVLALVLLVCAMSITYFGRFRGRPSVFQLTRVYKVACYLEREIDAALSEEGLDEFGNLNVVARNMKFLTYRGFFESDVETVTRLMAAKKGFQNGWVDIGREQTTFMFKLHNR